MSAVAPRHRARRLPDILPISSCSGDVAVSVRAAAKCVAVRFLFFMAYNPTAVAAAEAWLCVKPTYSSMSIRPLRENDLISR